VLKELASDYWSHELCQGVQDGDVACYCWVAYICGRVGIGAKGGVNGGSDHGQARCSDKSPLL
jgi:hypothetical protein